ESGERERGGAERRGRRAELTQAEGAEPAAAGAAGLVVVFEEVAQRAGPAALDLGDGPGVAERVLPGDGDGVVDVVGEPVRAQGAGHGVGSAAAEPERGPLADAQQLGEALGGGSVHVWPAGVERRDDGAPRVEPGVA